MILRPAAVLQSGLFRPGVEVVVAEGRIKEIRPLTGHAEPWVLSAAFVNAHSHLEYRGMLGRIQGDSFPSWIRAITMAKMEQSPDEVRADCLLAAEENRATGVALIGEHSDRPFARQAMETVGLRGRVFQELITFNEKDGAAARWESVMAKAAEQDAFVSPHAPYTVDRESLKRISQADHPLSIHAAESPAEHELLARGTGAFAAMYERFGIPLPKRARSPISLLAETGFLKPGRQLVHCCTADQDDLELMRMAEVVVAHCPRSNDALGCPAAPIREMLDSGIEVGLGLDSCASSGPIDFFTEMRAALECARQRTQPLTPEEVWRMGTTMGARTLGEDQWDVVEGSSAPLIALDVGDASSTEDLIQRGSPGMVRWIKAGV